MCVMNESCPPREREGTVVYTAEYRLMFSYDEGGKWRGRVSFRMEGWKEGRMMTEGSEDVVGQDKRDKLYISVQSLDNNAHSKCQNTSSPFRGPFTVNGGILKHS